MSLNISISSLPEGWSIAPLEKVSVVNMGQSPPSSTYNTDGEGLPFFQGKAEFGTFYPKVKKWCSVPSKVAQKEDILISVRAPVGPTNLAPSECCIGRGLAAIKPLGDLPSRYLLYYLRSIESDIDSLGTGSTFKAISGNVLRSINVPIAPLGQQKRIVAEIEKQFSRLDEAVANLKRVKANLKRYKAAVLKAAVEGKLTEEWRKRHPDVEPADKLLERILEERRANWRGRGKYKEPVGPDVSGLPELSVVWVWASVSALLMEPIVNGLSIKESAAQTEIRALRLSAMSDEGFDYNDHRFLPTSLDHVSDIIIREDDFFVSRGNGSLHLVCRSTLAQCPPFDVIFPDTMMRLRLVEAIRTTSWLRAIWPSRIVRRQIERRVKTTAGIYKISQPELAGITIPLPPLAEQHQIVAEVERRLSIVAGAEAQVDANLRRADRLRQSILKQAFSGRFVPQDSHDEPASVLPERIQANVNVNVGATNASPRIKTEKPKLVRQTSPLRKPRAVPVATDNFASLDTVLTALLDRMQPGQEYSSADLADPLGLSAGRWKAAIQELKRRGQVRQVGEKRGARYINVK